MENNKDKKPSSPWKILSDDGTVKTTSDNNSEQVKNDSDKKPEQVKNDSDKKPEPVKNDSDKKPETVKSDSDKKPETVKSDSDKKSEQVKNDSDKKSEPVKNDSDKKSEQVKSDSDKKPEQVKNDSDKKSEQVKNDSDKKPEPDKKSEPEKKISRDFLKSLGTTGFAILMAIVVAVAVIPVNMLASRLNVEWDMTPNSFYTGELSDVSKEIIENLSEPVDIYFLMDTADLDGDYEVGIVLKNTLEKYGEFDNINIISGDPDENPDLFSEFSDKFDSLNKGDIIVKGSNGLVKQVLATNLFLSEPLTSSESDNAEDYQYTFVGENYITGAIKYVTDGTEPYIYFLKGHGEKTITEDYTTLTSIFESYGYVVGDVNLKTEPAIPDQTQVIVIAAPETDITDSEYQLLDEYLDNGGHIAFLLSPNGDEVDYTNIDKLMYDFAIGIDYDRVYETDENMYMSGDKYTIAAYLNDVTDSTGSSGAGDENLTWVTEARQLIEQGYTLVMPESRSFYSYDEVAENNSALTANPIIYASPTARAENYGGVDKVGNFTDGEILYLAAYAEDTARNDAKILVWGNAEFADDEMYEKGYTVTSLSAFISSVAWLHDSSIDLGIAEKSFTLDYMQINSQSTANKILAVIIFIPVVVAGIGVLVWARRKNA